MGCCSFKQRVQLNQQNTLISEQNINSGQPKIQQTQISDEEIYLNEIMQSFDDLNNVLKNLSDDFDLLQQYIVQDNNQ